jgi:molybdopterin-guanine dinucleotide biosynthesis protein
MKRMTWFAGGVAAGAVGITAARRKVRTVAHDLAPTQVAKRATDSMRAEGNRITDAIREGRGAMRAKERELRARLDGRSSTLADEIDDIDTVLVDGKPVEAGQVIVLRQVRDSSSRRAARRA